MKMLEFGLLVWALQLAKNYAYIIDVFSLGAGEADCSCN